MSYLMRFKQQRQQALQTDTNANKPDASVGAVVNGANVIMGTLGPAWIWVTPQKGDQLGPPYQALNRTISAVWNTPVKLGVNSQGQPYIVDVADSQIDPFMSGTMGGSLLSQRVPQHSHEYGFGNYDLVSDRRLVEGKAWWRSVDGPFTIYINAFPYADSSGNDQYWPGGTLNLTSYLTSTSGQHQWIKIGFDPVAAVPAAFAGTPVSVIIPLQATDLAAISLKGYIPLAGVQVSYGQAISGDGDFIDCSYIRVSASAGSVGVGNVVGPASAVDHTLPRFDTTTGKLLEGSGVTVDDSDNLTLPGRLIAQSGQNVKVRVVTAAGAVTVATSDFVIVVNKASGAATTVNLPASPAAGDVYRLKDGKGDAATNNITLTPAAGNIDGAGTYVMNVNYQASTVVYNGTQWNLV